MAISDLPVYVIDHPEGHTTVRTTSITETRWWRELPEGHGYSQIEATINWKAQPGGGDEPAAAERVRAFLETLNDMDRSGLRLVAWEALQLALEDDRHDGELDGGRVSVVELGEYIAISKNPGGVVHRATRP